MNLKLDLQDLDSVAPGIHAMDYMKMIGIAWDIAVPVPLVDAWWFCGCRNVPDPLPDCLEISKSTAETISTFGTVYQHQQ